MVLPHDSPLLPNTNLGRQTSCACKVWKVLLAPVAHADETAVAQSRPETGGKRCRFEPGELGRARRGYPVAVLQEKHRYGG